MGLGPKEKSPMASLRVSTTKSEWLPDDPTASVPTRRWKLPSFTTWDDSRNQHHPTDSAEEAKKLTNKLKHVPHRVEHALACSSRFFILPQLGSRSFHIDSEIPSDLRKSESGLVRYAAEMFARLPRVKVHRSFDAGVD